MQINDSILAKTASSTRATEKAKDLEAFEKAQDFHRAFERHIDQEKAEQLRSKHNLDDADFKNAANQDEPSLDKTDGIEVSEVNVSEPEIASDRKLVDGKASDYPVPADRADESKNNVSSLAADHDARTSTHPDQGMRPEASILSKSDVDSAGFTRTKSEDSQLRIPSAIEAVLINEMRVEGTRMPPSHQEIVLGNTLIASQFPHSDKGSFPSQFDAKSIVENTSIPPKTGVPNGVVVDQTISTAIQTVGTVSSDQSTTALPVANREISHVELGQISPGGAQSPPTLTHNEKPWLTSGETLLSRSPTPQSETSAPTRSEVAHNLAAPIPLAQSALPRITGIPRVVLAGEDLKKIGLEHTFETRQELRFSNAAVATTQYARPEMSQTVIRQMTDAVRAQMTAENTVEIAMRPAELGRVRIALSPADAGMVVTISAERAETLEMMRRNIDDLARSFEEMGHENVTFNFEQGGGFEHKDDQPISVDQADKDGSPEALPKLENQSQISTLRTSNSGVDILV
jgi:hypothetical protein